MRAWLFVLLVAACGGGSTDSDGDADSDSDTTPTAPAVVAIRPADGTQAFPDAEITVTFSVPMDEASVRDAVSLEGPEGAVTLTAGASDGTTFAWTTAGPLAEDTDATVQVAASATSIDGVALSEPASATFHVGRCEEWTISMPEGATLANDGIAIGLSLATHACAEPFDYYAIPTLDGVEIDARFFVVGDAWSDEPLTLPALGGDATLHVNLFCHPDPASLVGEHALGVAITRWIPGSEEDPLVGEATSTVDLSRGEVRHPDAATTGVYDLPWDPSERASVASDPYFGGTPVAADGTDERSVTATVWDPDGSPLEQDFPYMVSLPAGYDADDSSDAALHGLVFVLQGWGVPYTDTWGYDEFIAEMRSRGYLFVHPQGSWYWDPQSPALQGGADPTQRGDYGCHVGWMDYQMRISDPLAFGLAPEAGDHNNHDWYSPVFQAVAEDVVRAFTFDPKRVHAIGFSCGAAYAAVLGAWYPDRFATVVLDEPNPSPIAYMDEYRWTPPMIGQPRRTRYLLVAGDASLGPYVSATAGPLFEDFFCWEGDVFTFPGGHTWYLNQMEMEAADFMEEHGIEAAEIE